MHLRDAILGCPFCGGAARLVRGSTGASDAGPSRWIAIECVSCSTRSFGVSCETAPEMAEALLTDSWNRRVGAPGGEVRRSASKAAKLMVH